MLLRHLILPQTLALKRNQVLLHTPLTIPARQTADATNLKAELCRDIILINIADIVELHNESKWSKKGE